MLPRKKEGQKAQHDTACERCQSRNYHRIVFHVLLHTADINDRQILKNAYGYQLNQPFSALNTGAFVARVQILFGRCARCLISAQPVFERIRRCGLITNSKP